jgi:hypothetical protein
MSNSSEGEPSGGAAEKTQQNSREFSREELRKILARHAGWVYYAMGDLMPQVTPEKWVEEALTNPAVSECRNYSDPQKWVEEALTNPERADLSRAFLGWMNLSGVMLSGANLSGARLRGANLSGADLNGTNLSGAKLSVANLSDAKLYNADLSDANLSDANLSGANLSYADLRGADLNGANLSEARVSLVRWDRSRMRGKYGGIRGIDSCYGNALFKRWAADQDFLDTLEESWSESRWRRFLFSCWEFIDYGRSLLSVLIAALFLVYVFGSIYASWPDELLGSTMNGGDVFTPFYFSIVTFTTLGFGEIHPMGHLWGEIIVSIEVILGYLTLGLLLSVLAEKIARRS